MNGPSKDHPRGVADSNVTVASASVFIPIPDIAYDHEEWYPTNFTIWTNEIRRGLKRITRRYEEKEIEYRVNLARVRVRADDGFV